MEGRAGSSGRGSCSCGRQRSATGGAAAATAPHAPRPPGSAPRLLTCAGLLPDMAAGLHLDQLATPRHSQTEACRPMLVLASIVAAQQRSSVRRAVGPSCRSHEPVQAQSERGKRGPGQGPPLTACPGVRERELMVISRGMPTVWSKAAQSGVFPPQHQQRGGRSSCCKWARR